VRKFLIKKVKVSAETSSTSFAFCYFLLQISFLSSGKRNSLELTSRETLKLFQSKCTSVPKDTPGGTSGKAAAKATKGEREVVQWHFTAWPDHATPPSPVALLHFVRRSSQSNPANAGPMVVHCR
jgi:hypothetical protein